MTPAPPDEARPQAAPAGENGRQSVRWLFGFVRPELARLGLVLMLSLLSTGLALVQPAITKFLIDDGLLAGRIDVVAWLCGLMFGAGLLGALLGGFNRWHYITLSGRILFSLRESVYRHLQRLSPAFYAKASGGDLLARLDGDIGEIQRFSVDTPLALVNGLIALAGALAFMLWLSWQLSFLAFVLLPAEVLFLRAMRPRIERQTRGLRERASTITGFFFDTLGAMKFIQSMAAEGREAGRLGGLNADYLRHLLRLQMTGFVTATVPGLMISLSTAIVFVAGGYLTIRGELTLGTLIAFSVYLGRATGPVQTLLGLYLAVTRARVSLTRVEEMTRVAPAVRPPARPRPLPEGGAGELRLDDIWFRYEDGGAEVLRGASALFPAGAKVAIVGASGIGKTTLIDLLHRHYDPDRGRVLLDGVDLRELDLGELRRRVAVVAQDTALLPGSIADNIRYANPEASDGAVREAAAGAQLDAFVASLEAGYDTEVGARGTALSGGERQRVAIARALLQDPLVLILDEATSAVDAEAEARIAAAIDALFATRTRLVISHHAAALVRADLVLELVDGRLRPAAGAAAGSRGA